MTPPPHDSHLKGTALALRITAILIAVDGVFGSAAAPLSPYTRTAVITFLRYVFPDPRSPWSLLPVAIAFLAGVALLLCSYTPLSHPLLLCLLSLLVLLDFVALQLAFGLLEPAHGLLFFFLIRPVLPRSPPAGSRPGS